MLRAVPLNSGWRAKGTSSSDNNSPPRQTKNKNTKVRSSHGRDSALDFRRLHSDLLSALPPGLPPVLAPLFPLDGSSLQIDKSTAKQMAHHQMPIRSGESSWPPMSQGSNAMVTSAIDWVTSPKTSPQRPSPCRPMPDAHPLLPHLLLSHQLNLGLSQMPQGLQFGSPSGGAQHSSPMPNYGSWQQMPPTPMRSRSGPQSGYRTTSSSSSERMFYNNVFPRAHSQEDNPGYNDVRSKRRPSNDSRGWRGGGGGRSWTRSTEWRPSSNGNVRPNRRRASADSFNQHAPGPAGDARKASESTSKVESVHTTEASGGGSLVVRREKGGHVDVRIVYARDFMLQCAYSPYALLPPPWLPHMARDHLEVLPSLPKKFDPKRYKKMFGKR